MEWILGRQNTASAREGALVTEPSLETQDGRNGLALPQAPQKLGSRERANSEALAKPALAFVRIPFQADPSRI